MVRICRNGNRYSEYFSDSRFGGKLNFAWYKYGKKKAFELAVMARKLKSTDRDCVIARVEKNRATKQSKKKASKLRSKKQQGEAGLEAFMDCIFSRFREASRMCSRLASLNLLDVSFQPQLEVGLTPLSGVA